MAMNVTVHDVCMTQGNDLSLVIELLQNLHHLRRKVFLCALKQDQVASCWFNLSLYGTVY